MVSRQAEILTDTIRIPYIPLECQVTRPRRQM